MKFKLSTGFVLQTRNDMCTVWIPERGGKTKKWSVSLFVSVTQRVGEYG